MTETLQRTRTYRRPSDPAKSRDRSADGNGIVPSDTSEAAAATDGLLVRIGRHDHADLSDGQVADLVIDELRSLADPWPVVHGVLVDEVRRCRRGRVRRREHAATREYTPGDGTLLAESAVRRLTMSQLELMVGQRVHIPGVGYRRAETVTVDEWGARIEGLRAQISQDLATVSVCEAIVSTLRTLRVDTIASAIGGVK